MSEAMSGKTTRSRATRDPAWEYRLIAENHARDSQNAIHDDEVANAYGFRGGLVPGVDVYAYLTQLPARRWGLAWLRTGSLSASFLSPVYDGDALVVVGEPVGDGAVELTMDNPAGDVCARGTASNAGEAARPPDPADWPAGSPDTRGAVASSESLAPGTALVPLEFGFHADRAGPYLAEIGDPLDVYRDEAIAHPGWLLRFANFVLAAQVRLGPWIHVSSDTTFFDVVHDGQHVEVRAVVSDEYERKGHRFVVLDVLTMADGVPVMRAAHTAIHTLRPPRSEA